MLLVPPVLLILGFLIALMLEDAKASYASFALPALVLGYCVRRFSKVWAQSAGLVWIMPVLIVASDAILGGPPRYMKYLLILIKAKGKPLSRYTSSRFPRSQVASTRWLRRCDGAPRKTLLVLFDVVEHPLRLVRFGVIEFQAPGHRPSMDPRKSAPGEHGENPRHAAEEQECAPYYRAL